MVLRGGWAQISILAVALVLTAFFFNYERQWNSVLRWDANIRLENGPFDKFYEDYVAFLNESLATKNFSAGVILHASADGNGLGNRWPSLITSFLLAMLTKKVF